MPKFIYVYHGGSMPQSDAEVAEVMGMWKAWFGEIGQDVVDPGNPVGMSKTVFADRVADDGGANPTSGYSIVSASDVDDAVAKAKGCPILKRGGSVEVAEVIELPLARLLDSKQRVRHSWRREVSPKRASEGSHSAATSGNGYEMVIPGIPCGENLIWGATAMILDELAQLLHQ